MGEDVEQPGARRLAEPLEVAPPDLLGRLAGRPHVVVVVVDGVRAEEVHRADDVVPFARLEQVGRPVLAAGDEVDFDAEPEVRLLAHERAVVVEVVARVALPQRMVPDLEGLAEPVHVLADAELGDAALGRHRAVALGVGGGEVTLGGRARVVRAQVDVVVGQQGAARPASGPWRW